MFNLLYDRKTHIPEKGVVVSTVGWDAEIGWKRTAETMAFPADKDGNIVSWSEVYFESHGMYPSQAELDAAHERIVQGIRDGSIQLDQPAKADDEYDWDDYPEDEGEAAGVS